MENSCLWKTADCMNAWMHAGERLEEASVGNMLWLKEEAKQDDELFFW